ncbi:BREX-1 system adenine-specific DNA-methyltransferase PglX [Saccharicrinis sp. GN24d3]|uniref:BREX-1 system adenine-specific DNA-methyltransferase PglX n=1 Tax=Saccharicrinis sp. GN24d3 TaxID=3458416 RepID=UPI004036AA4C
MNTNILKRFAQQARKKLIEQVGARLELVLSTDSAELREKANPIKKLQDAINETSKEQVIDKVAYTWFNRLMALRFMDANDYQPIGMGVVTPKPGHTLPELLDEAKQGHIPDDMPVKVQHVYDVLDGKIPSANAQNEAYKELLIGACNYLHKIFPFLFERISDYTELLLPDDLISEFSIVHDFQQGMTTEGCREVEVIGWLYQFYISERKDEVFASKSKVAKEDIPAATQLFTPRWIVEYMVQNTLGKLWLQNRPNSGLRAYMPYYIESPSAKTEEYLKVASVEEITLLDQACGSGHILVYAFELFTKIYEEEGYNASEIPQLIIENNLFGFEIDERAAQLAGLALMIKARSYQRRVFRKDIKPNILCYQDLHLKAYGDDYKTTFKISKDNKELKDILKYQYVLAEDITKTTEKNVTDKETGKVHTLEKTKKLIKNGWQVGADNYDTILEHDHDDIFFYQDEIRDTCRTIKLKITEELYIDLLHMTQATILGSLIVPKAGAEEISKALALVIEKSNTTDAFLSLALNQLKQALQQLQLLSNKYHCIVDNPPYMGGGNMNKPLADFVKDNYPSSKADLMACFMETGLKVLHPMGFLGMINQHSWMFLSSYEELRKQLIENTFFDTLLHLGPRTFPEIGGEVVQNASFTFWNTIKKDKGSYIRLVDEGTSELKRNKTIEAIQNSNCGWFYVASQLDFEKIPGSPIGYWLRKNVINVFDKEDSLGINTIAKQGLATGDNEHFARLWHEVAKKGLCLFADSCERTEELLYKWYPYNKGGAFRRWYGNIVYVVNWLKNGNEIRNFKDTKGKLRSRPQNTQFYFNEGLTWSDVTSGNLSCRYLPIGNIYDISGHSAFPKDEQERLVLIAYMNTKFVNKIAKLLNPTLHFQIGDFCNIPTPSLFFHESVTVIASENINLSKSEWNTRETSWDFLQNELNRIASAGLSNPKHHIDLEESFDLYQQYWQNKFYQLHKNEEELNKQFIEIYGLQEELTPDVPLADITILKEELDQKQLKAISERYKSAWQLVDGGQWVVDSAQSPITNHQLPKLPFNPKEIFKQFISYAVGCMFGRYSLDKEGLILANQGETLSDYIAKVQSSKSKVQSIEDLSFVPDDDNIIPVLDDEWFEDDIVGRFKAFLKISFGTANYDKNLAFVEDCLGKDIRKYFLKDFYTDHIKRYKKRPIYWQFSSPSNSFSVLIYMHRYTPDTLHNILNGYLKEYREKLNTRVEHLDHLIQSGTSAEQTKAAKEKEKLQKVLHELQEYERDILYPLATERIAIDLDDGVLVNYNKFAQAIKQVSGLNDKKTKDKVKGFDWIDVEGIR